MESTFRMNKDLNKKMESVQAEELLSRFRSKEDLYRYMTQQGKSTITHDDL